MDELFGDLGWQAFCCHTAEGGLHDDSLNIAEQLRGLGTSGLIAGEHEHRHVEVPGDGPVQTIFTHQDVIQPQVGYPAAGPGVVQNGVLTARAGVITHEDDPIDTLVNALDHGEGRVVAADQVGKWVQLLEQDVCATVVPVGNQDRICPAFTNPAYGCIDIVGHQTAKARVFRMIGVNLIPVGHSGDAFHVGGDKDFHAGFSWLFLQVIGHIDDNALKALCTAPVEQGGFDQQGSLVVQQLLPPPGRDELR